ncbi:hypothetical protein RDWZM_009037 [Blomia tropicalis]|uniref:EIPR1-like beta-propeller domain-containing protein n=1 Tax=Blomia tropicalis TaxID=40697 RepID=A0A9Q0M5T2_BLOTA|nr:Protein tssc1 [Blomia tropicalis]KAJ6217880.1 hypothetical protein RDWZM_009037 [Blomia tropicalis]
MSANNTSNFDSTNFIPENPPLIYGLDHECRSLCAQYNDSLPTRFFVGTQSLEVASNQVHLLEYVEENDSLAKAVFKHGLGEIWHLISPSKTPNQLITCYTSNSNLNKVENHCSLWRLPIDVSENLREDDAQTIMDLEKIHDFNQDNLGTDESIGKIGRLKPDDENELILMMDTKLAHFDLTSQRLIGIISNENQTIKTTSRLSRLNTFSWSPHFNGNLLCLVSNNNIYSKDLRSANSAWNIPQAHSQTVRDIDFNPNSQYYIASCGDDCEVKFWDIRNVTKPALKMLHHSHWLWSVRYNSFHDHLVLTSSSDGNVNLLRASTIASQPYGHLIEDELDEEDINIKEMLSAKQKLQDGLIVKFQDHEDSVYSIEWSPNDPWLFASLSYDGRFIINKVPESEKLSIID